MFCVQPSAGSDERLSTQMPQQWRFPGTYRFGYDHPAYDGTTFELLCVPLGSAITIHGKGQCHKFTNIGPVNSTIFCNQHRNSIFRNLLSLGEPVLIYIRQILCVCVSVKYRRPNGPIMTKFGTHMRIDLGMVPT